MSTSIAAPAMVLFLMALRKKVAQESDVPPFAVFQEYSLEDMALKYPINIQEMSHINGVGEGKARRYGKAWRTEDRQAR